MVSKEQLTSTEISGVNTCSTAYDFKMTVSRKQEDANVLNKAIPGRLT
jgi:hypothetical protein